MHNGQLADPLNAWTQKLAASTKKKNKTITDHEEIGRVEFQGSLYWDERPVIYASALDAVIKKGAAVNRKGKAVEAGVEVMGDAFPLMYDGPTDREGLWNAMQGERRTFADRRGVRVQRNVVIRTRPIFRDWRLTFDVVIWEFAAVNPVDLEDAIRNGGRAVGLGDFRPKFGIFELEKFKEVKA